MECWKAGYKTNITRNRNGERWWSLCMNLERLGPSLQHSFALFEAEPSVSDLVQRARISNLDKILLSEKCERINHFLTRGKYLSLVVGMPDCLGGRFFDAGKDRSRYRLTIRFRMPTASSSRYALSALCTGKKAPIKSLDFPSSLMT